ncbi:MAG TPA: UDP-3-O-(3-hydroxymyristoyl)glucosamine N-acyltransferase [Beijerinckiaceae bacterium]|nr:UDP-3-O-(3-hydroxymyristoyl)glucosamine N-acyltransferase [Beijerinckiaceae bacterium]
MTAPAFFPLPEPLSVARLIELTGATVAEGIDRSLSVRRVAPLEMATGGDLTFLENTAYADAAATTAASACFIAAKLKDRLAPGVVALVTAQPYRAYAQAAAVLYPAAMRPMSLFGGAGVSPGASVHPTARLEEHVTVDPGAVIGPGAEIGARCIIGPGAVIGPGVKLGRDASIGAGATVQHAFLGNRVIVHPGVRIGQDGFGFAMGPGGHVKVPQVGRVIIQDDVEIGANTTIDRGTTRDTVIGEGTKIDNLVQIGHNVSIGRHCVIVSQVGISGSSTLEDYVVLAGQAGVAGHVRIGMGAQVGAKSGVMTDLAAGGRYLGAPAKPARQTMREVAALARLAERGKE